MWQIPFENFYLTRPPMGVKPLTISHFQYPDSKIKTDILWIRIFVSALVHTACRAALSHPK